MFQKRLKQNYEIWFKKKEVNTIAVFVINCEIVAFDLDV
jgi:hypothetical protein